MNSLFCYCCQGLLNIFPQNNEGKRVMWNISSLMQRCRPTSLFQLTIVRRVNSELDVYNKITFK